MTGHQGTRALLRRDRPGWFDRAACSGLDPEMFHPGAGQPGIDQAREARAVCAGCGAVRECLRWALRDPGVLGIAGGTSAEQRKALRRVTA